MRVIRRNRSRDAHTRIRACTYVHLRAARGINYVMTPCIYTPPCTPAQLERCASRALALTLPLSCAEKFQRRIGGRYYTAEIERRDVDRAERSIKFDPICVSRENRSIARRLTRRSH